MGTIALKVFAIFAACGIFIPMTAKSVEIVAHRGENTLAPENSVASAKLAWERGVKMLECDIHATKSGDFVCIHCSKVLEKMSGVKKDIADLTPDDLHKIDISDNPQWRGKYKNVRIPTYEDIVATMPKDGILVVEIKKYSADFLDKTDELLKKYGLDKSRILFISFNYEWLRDIKSRSSSYKVLFLASLKEKEGRVVPSASYLVRKCAKIGAEGVDLGSNTKLIDRAYVDEIHSAGLKFYVWTVDDVVEAKRLKEIGVDGITTDTASEFIKALK